MMFSRILGSLQGFSPLAWCTSYWSERLPELVEARYFVGPLASRVFKKLAILGGNLILLYCVPYLISCILLQLSSCSLSFCYSEVAVKYRVPV